MLRAIALSACVAACSPSLTPPLIVCPTIKEYSREFQASLAKDLEQAPDTVMTAMADYKNLRDQTRLCQTLRQHMFTNRK